MEYCAGYYESPWTLEEVVYALFHDGKFPDKKEQDLYAWNIEQSVDADEEVISFFRFGKFRKKGKKKNRYNDIDIKQLYNELRDYFYGWENDEDERESEDYESFWCSTMEEYGYEKSINISNIYDKKFLNCTITNLNDNEKNDFMDIIQKYCNHIC